MIPAVPDPVEAGRRVGRLVVQATWRSCGGCRFNVVRTRYAPLPCQGDQLINGGRPLKVKREQQGSAPLLF